MHFCLHVAQKRIYGTRVEQADGKGFEGDAKESGVYPQRG